MATLWYVHRTSINTHLKRSRDLPVVQWLQLVTRGPGLASSCQGAGGCAHLTYWAHTPWSPPPQPGSPHTSTTTRYSQINKQNIFQEESKRTHSMWQKWSPLEKGLGRGGLDSREYFTLSSVLQLLFFTWDSYSWVKHNKVWLFRVPLQSFDLSILQDRE